MGSAEHLMDGGHHQWQNDEQTQPPVETHTIGDTGKSYKCSATVKKLIENARETSSPFLDLSGQELTEVPEAVLRLDHLEHVYFEGNHISKLPDDFFDTLPNLKWLDLRYNRLMYLPSAFLARHRHLKTLLLQGNHLRTLPLELGLVASLKGLSLSENPLEFPPSHIIEQGTERLLKYLRESMLEKNKGDETLDVNDLDRMASLSVRDNDDSGASTHDDDDDNDNVPRQPTTSPAPTRDFGLQPRSAELHMPVSYYQIRQQHMKRVEAASGGGKLLDGRRNLEPGKKTRHPVITPYPEPPPGSRIEVNAAEEGRKKRISQIKEKQESILQRRRNEEALGDFRLESRKLQRNKYHQYMRRGEDFTDTANIAPYGYQSDYDKVRSKEELIKHEVRLAHETMARPMSPATKERLDEERMFRHHLLEKKLRQHTTSMVERRQKSRGTTTEELEAARREILIGLELEKEILERKKELEYRFQAYTGDISLPQHK